MFNKEYICSFIYKILSSLIAAAGISAIAYLGLITSSILPFIYVSLIIGIVSLIIALFSCKNRCKNEYLLTTSIIAIIINAFALAATPFASISIPVAILIGAITFIFINNIIEIFKFLICFLCKRECK